MDYRPLYENAIFIAPLSEGGFFRDYRKAHPKVKFDVLTIEEVESMCSLTYEQEAIAYLVGKDYPYPFALDLLSGLSHMEDRPYKSAKLNDLLPLYNELRQKGLLYQDNVPQAFFRGRPIIIRGYGDGLRFSFAAKDLPNISVSFELPRPRANKVPHYSFSDIHEELHYLCNRIAALLRGGVDPKDIYVLGLPDDCVFEMGLMCKAYGIPFFHNSPSSLYDLPFTKTILKRLEEEESADILGEFASQLVDIDQEKVLRFLSLFGNIGLSKQRLLATLEEAYKDTSCQKEKGKGIQLSSSRNIPSGCHAFLVDFTFGKAPRIHRDVSYFEDNERAELGLMTSLQRNKSDQAELVALLKREELEYVSSSLIRMGATVYPSPLASDDSLIQPATHSYEDEYSKDMAPFVLMSLEDDFRRIRKESPYRKKLEEKIALPDEYGPEFRPFPEAKQSGPLSLSFSGIDAYFHCPFRYYLGRVLKLQDDGNPFIPRLGTLLHAFMEKVETSPLDDETTYAKVIANEEKLRGPFSTKERFFIQAAKPSFFETVHFLQQNYGAITNPRFEHEKDVRLQHAQDVLLRGKIDLAIVSGSDPYCVSILDYKTKGKEYNEKQTQYGLNLQLPIYAYFASEVPDLKRYPLLGTYFVPLLPTKGEAHSLTGLHEKNPSYSQFDPNPSESKFVASKAGVKYEGESLGEHLVNIAKKKIDEAVDGIRKGDFPISPISINTQEIEGCKYCSYKDICHRRDSFIRYEEGDDDASDA